MDFSSLPFILDGFSIRFLFCFIYGSEMAQKHCRFCLAVFHGSGILIGIPMAGEAGGLGTEYVSYALLELPSSRSVSCLSVMFTLHMSTISTTLYICVPLSRFRTGSCDTKKVGSFVSNLFRIIAE